VIVGRVREDARLGLDRETGLRERIARLLQKHPDTPPGFSAA
jgi:hypothetical protein